ncbi:MAG: hypothetical protein K2Q10_02890 [Rhodospirillales bacterium]|nr:hypothetical protein [Rhodospirillales bacterium]
MSDTVISIEGASAREIAAALSALLNELFGQPVTMGEVSRAVSAEKGPLKDGVMAVLLIQGAIADAVALSDFAQRMEFVPKVERLIQEARRYREASGARIVMTMPDRTEIPLDRATAGQVLDALRRSHADAR